MPRFGWRLCNRPAILLLCAVLLSAAIGSASASQVLLEDGRILEGKLGVTAGLAEIPRASQPDGSGPLQLILFVDDNLRRTFVSKRLVKEVREEDPGQLVEKFRVRQRVLRRGRLVKSVGPIIRIQPFDEYGRRIFTMNTTRGPVDIIQGITEVHPTWTKVEGISHLWDMRIATSSIPRDVLSKILRRQIDPKNVEHRKKIARFYLQSERYEDAYNELEGILADYPNDANIKEQLDPSMRRLKQLAARRLLAELKLRREAGQHRLVLGKLKNFPSEGVAGEILQEIRELIDQYKSLEAQGTEVLKQFDGVLAKIDDSALRERLKPVAEEITKELNINTLDRMAAFRQMVDDDSLLPTEKLALAISGWLLGGNSASVNLPVSLSAFEVRDLVRQYLNEPIKLNRSRIYGQFHSQEAASPAVVAKLLAHMKPPTETPPPDEETPGFYELQAPGLPRDPPITYLVQLPPEYDPYRRYPTIVTLHGAGTTASQQIDWWAGAWTKDRWRRGQAARHGYIVIAPAWTVEHQKKYHYSAREHAAVLNCLRDACRRFAVDPDRVFLSGHSIGGDAAWDVGLAHPDLWCGVIPIVAKADRYCALYWENAELVPFYFVCGELDGGKMTSNARDLDRYLKRGYNVTVVEFLGRGHEHFSDEIQRVFDWMGLWRRNFFPREFTCVTMRSWDNYFWWVELNSLPSKAMINPYDWPPPRGTQAVQTKASLTANNGVRVRTATGRVTVWLSPEMIDFERPMSIVVNGKRLNTRDPALEPNLLLMLEDVRSRGDRQHPFWAKVEMPTGRLSSGR